MGACYFVSVDLVYKNGPDDFCKLIREEIDKHSKKNVDFGDLSGLDLTKPSDCFKAITSQRDFLEVNGVSHDVYSSGFDASYGWGDLLYNIFLRAAKEVLADGSEIYVEPDNYAWKIAIHDGKIYDIDYEYDWDEEANGGDMKVVNEVCINEESI